MPRPLHPASVTMRRSNFTSPLCAVLTAPTSGLAAQAYVVDVNGGAGANFTSITAAVAAVPDGAILRVRPGDYVESVVVTAKDRFDAAASPLLNKTNTVRVESARLARIRDALLPRLLSGELTIPNAERIVGAAT